MRRRWLVIEGQVPLRIELSRTGAEAASQVVHVINQRVRRDASRHSSTSATGAGTELLRPA